MKIPIVAMDYAYLSRRKDEKGVKANEEEAAEAPGVTEEEPNMPILVVKGNDSFSRHLLVWKFVVMK
mgnify:CR=1 FL=1